VSVADVELVKTGNQADNTLKVSPRSGTAPPKEYLWKPGQSGNPLGRPKRPDIAHKLCKELDTLQEENGLTKEEAIVQVITNLALDGHTKMIDSWMIALHGQAKRAYRGI